MQPTLKIEQGCEFYSIMSYIIICMIKIATHSGGFHTDDVFAVATLQLLYGIENVEVIRTRNESVLETAEVVVDVGGAYDVARQRFDHHQNGAPVRTNGVPYSAFGLVWKEYGAKVAGSQAVADEIERVLVLAVDAGDSGMSLYTLNNPDMVPYELYQITRSFLPEWGSSRNKDEAFLEAVDFARLLLLRVIAHKQADQTMKQLIADVYQNTEDKRVLVFDRPVSAVACIEYPEVLLVICPDDSSENNNWTATTVRKEYSSFEARVKFPDSWAGLKDAELAHVSRVADAVFCHKAGFLFVAGSKEGVMAGVREVVG